MATHAPSDTTGAGLDLDYPWLETVDLNTFERLPEKERMRVIIRVLCELVALDPDASEDPSTASVPTTSSGSGRRVHRLRRLPFLGVEVDGARKLTNLRSSGALSSPHHRRTA